MSKSDIGSKKHTKQADIETRSENTRRSTRAQVPTEKMLAYQQEEQQKKKKKVISLYDKWKIEARNAREQLKSDLSDTQLAILIETLEIAKNKVLSAYDEFRKQTLPDVEMRRKMDSCEAVTTDVTRIVNERIAGIDGDYSYEREKERLSALSYKYANSIFGSTASQVSQEISDHSGHCSVLSDLEAKRVDAAAEVAAKQAAYNSLMAETKQKEKIKELEDQHKKALEVEFKELEQIQAQKDLKVAQAKLDVYSEEVEKITSSLNDCSSASGSELSQGNERKEVNRQEPNETTNPSVKASTSEFSALVQALQDGISASKLPVPEPPIFTGDPIHFIEFKQSFMALIDKKGISSADKMFYLKKYVSGPARKALDGTFFRTDDEVYKDAWDKLNHRYGHPFIIQKAFRERLANWPKIHPKDAMGLQAFSDFLNACRGALPHVKGLQILNDYQENQKLMQKLPDWAISRWNRQVTQSITNNHEYPTFDEFAVFVSTEADVACNPVTSFHALHNSGYTDEKVNMKEVKKNRVRVLATQSNTEGDQYVIKSSNKTQCVFCQKNNHQLDNCSKFLSRPLEERRQYIQEKKLCYGCLNFGHSAKVCRYRLTCDTCNKKHPTSLHNNNFVKMVRTSSSAVQTQNDPEGTANAVTLNVAGEEPGVCTSMIVPVWVSAKHNPSCEQLVYALLDSQSDTTFIDKSVSDSLKAASFPVKLKLTTMLGRDTVLQSERVTGLQVRAYKSSDYIDLPATYTKDCIPANRHHIPTNEVAEHWKHLSVIADKIPPLQDCDVGLLIGYNCSRSMIPREVIVGGDDEPYAVQTDLGWSIVGCSPRSDLFNVSRLCHRIAVRELPSITPVNIIRALESDFKDADEETVRVSQDDILFLEKLKSGISKNIHGHYQMPLPFKVRPKLPNNKRCAMVRLDHLKRKMVRDESYMKNYNQFMSQIFQRGDAEEVHSSGKEGETWYLPHHGVFHPKKADKLRVVFDCSARHEGSSLNDHLLQGPDLINSLHGILIRFRQHPIALTCDVEKMYHQFHVDEPDRDFLRFLWWKNGDITQPVHEFRMKVHLFGAASSSGCANYGLKHLATENGELYPLGSQFLLKNFYVDDGVISVENVHEAIKVADEARRLCALGGLRLHKFLSNNELVLKGIPQSERMCGVRGLDLAFDELPLERTLGLQWDRESDCFKFKVHLKEQPASRRGILSAVASVYDPLGLIAPVLFNGKRILQEMCKNGSGWDDPLMDGLSLRWVKWKQDLQSLQNLSIPRTYVPLNFGKPISIELHHFSDASNDGYGQCSYVRVKNEEGNVHCALVMAKSRVAPLKVVTVPRLELAAAVVSVEVSNVLKRELDYPVANETFWTDSKVLLGYISNEARRFHTFVANRVQRICRSTKIEQWRYVPTERNPADYASRGLTVKQLLDSDWFTGPKFLWETEMFIPSEPAPALLLGDPEVKSLFTLNTECQNSFNLANRLTKFSSWTKAVGAVARLLRRANKDRSSSLSTMLERQKAELHIIKCLQESSFKDELKEIKGGRGVSCGALRPLDPFVDLDGVLRVGGRLTRSSYPDSVKHPIIIPKTHQITQMIVAHYHNKVMHQGKGFTVNEIRSNGFWIPGINKVVASFIKGCVVCRKLRRPVEEQKMADLPPERVDPSPPFLYTGMDCFGPFSVKSRRNVQKRYGLLLTCLCSRAVHIELLNDLTTDSFINALRCFIAIRGTVRQLRSDQGTNFVGARNELKGALCEMDPERITTFLLENQCEFIMNTPHASHAGGVWERQIRTIRSVLNATFALYPGKLDDSCLRAFLYEAMAIVNSRPLTVDCLNDPQSLRPITPNNLLTLKPVTALPPPGKFLEEDVYARKRWRHVQYLAEQFWSRWRKEYLANIVTRQKWNMPKRNLQINDIVLVKEENLPRNEWKLGRIQETISSGDGLIRKAKVLLGDCKLDAKGKRTTKQSIIERPVQKLVLLKEGNE
nr:uncharacterized protein LOC103910029 [Danio rerio]XP_021336929.1 uncharacterized protein LOC103910029 [Danio rerio]|eukprot:XP_021336928.1 uncharacterized protein LOC103910029 [Danio rerio]